MSKEEIEISKERGRKLLEKWRPILQAMSSTTSISASEMKLQTSIIIESQESYINKKL